MEATYAFEDVGHSLDARDLLAQYYIGDLHEVSIAVFYKSIFVCFQLCTRVFTFLVFWVVHTLHYQKGERVFR